MQPLFYVPSGIELVIIAIILILLFSANKLPKIVNSIGRSIGEFEKGRKKVEQELEEQEK